MLARRPSCALSICRLWQPVNVCMVPSEEPAAKAVFSELSRRVGQKRFKLHHGNREIIHEAW